MREWHAGTSVEAAHANSSEAEHARTAASVGAGHLVVTHVPPGGDPDVHRAEAARSFGGPVSAAHGGACYTV